MSANSQLLANQYKTIIPIILDIISHYFLSTCLYDYYLKISNHLFSQKFTLLLYHLFFLVLLVTDRWNTYF